MSISTHALTEGDDNERSGKSSNRISTHALTEGDRGIPSPVKPSGISTHALTEGDWNFWEERVKPFIFQLTPSRRATRR